MNQRTAVVNWSHSRTCNSQTRRSFSSSQLSYRDFHQTCLRHVSARLIESYGYKNRWMEWKTLNLIFSLSLSLSQNSAFVWRVWHLPEKLKRLKHPAIDMRTTWSFCEQPGGGKVGRCWVAGPFEVRPSIGHWDSLQLIQREMGRQFLCFH